MSNAPILTVRQISLTERPVTLRLPFQFGSTEVRHTSEIYCKAEVTIGGRAVTGRSAQLMVPRWFDKRANLSNEDTVEELRQTASQAAASAIGMTGSAATLSRELREAVAAHLPADIPALAAGFGPALIEMALIDALCRLTGLPFWRAARDDLFGLSADLPQDLGADDFKAALNRIAPPQRLRLRHTIGFDAPLTERPGDAPMDGLPVTLTEVMARTGIQAWKIKLKGDPDADAARLLALQQVLAGQMGGGVTLDANEQYTPDNFRMLLDRLHARDLAPITRRVRFFEQPFAREVALELRNDFRVPIVIDESDDHMDAFTHALDLGWLGSSIKSCKGVLRALVNMARARAVDAILTGEDLTCQPGLCWTQDSAMAAACGVPDVERNGHHFAGGLQGAGPGEKARFLALHPGIFRQDGDVVTLNIRDGQVDISSLDAPGFGASEAAASQEY